MKASVKSSELNKALNLCAGTIDSKDVLRSNVMIIAEDNHLKLQASNSRFSLTVFCDAEIEEDGKTVIDCKTASNVLKKAVGDCELKTNDNSTIIGTNGRTKLPNIGKDVPMFPSVEGKQFVCDAQALKKAFTKVSYSLATDQSRLILTGAHVVSHDGFITLTAIDGFRLAQSYIAKKSGDDIDIVIPADVFEMACSAIKDGDLTFTTSGIHLSISSSNFIIDSVLLSGNYIDTERIIPKDFATKVKLKTKDFLDILESATVASGDTNLVTLDVSTTTVGVTSKSKVGEFETRTADVMVQGEHIAISFNLRYLIQAFAHVTTESVGFAFTTPTSPAVIFELPEEQNVASEFHLLLPVRTYG